ncbi:MAG: D-glycero-beta-D-manno-heptose 1-phosphate adenylyltransferase [Proteobacteria bacterium]|nr:D-glycero-beta-D-manno-heptose 1-phosphate adenylyltransferase [Pseudomonadota bacterium]
MEYLALSTQSKIILDHADLSRKIEQVGRPLVFTNGCFDIMHRGHVDYLEQAASLGNSLLVALNTDASVKKLNKGDDRPVNTLEDRMAVIAALECVSLVTWFDEETPYNVIKLARPDHLVKGGDWPVDKIVGADLVQSTGGQVHSIAFSFDRSTTSLLEKIRSHDDS